MAPRGISLRQQNLRVATWNVRTLLDREGTNRPERRTALVARELSRYNIDIAALSETRLAGEGQLEERNAGYTFFWRGKPDGEPRMHGVGFAVRTQLVRDHNLYPVGINERLMTLRIPVTHGRYASLISAYAPTLTSDEETKEDFYSNLRTCLSRVHPQDKLLVLGDFNARVGRDYDTWEGVLGKEGVGNCNQNGLLLLGLCTEQELVVTNTLFRQKTRFKTTWMHPRSRHWHMIDYVLTRQRDRSDVHLTRVARGADDCWTDHKMVFSKLILKIKLKPRVRQQQLTRVKYAVDRLRDLTVATSFTNMIQSGLQENPVQESVSVDEEWDFLKSIVRQVFDEVLGTRKRRHQDWFDENALLWKMTRVQQVKKRDMTN